MGHIFEIEPVSVGKNFAAAWFDDNDRTWDDQRLRRDQPLAPHWVPPALALHRPEDGPTPVLFNPNAYAVSPEVRRELEPLADLEFLPVNIAACGTYFIIRPQAFLNIPSGAVVRRPAAPAHGNVVLIEALPSSFTPRQDVFSFRQPLESPSGKVGGIVLGFYANPVAAEIIGRAAGGYLYAKPVKDA